MWSAPLRTVRAVLAVPFVLLVPGYALRAALLPGRAFGAVTDLAVSLGFSLAVVIVSGVGLNWTPWGLQSRSWTVLLAAITAGAAAVALVRHRVRWYDQQDGARAEGWHASEPVLRWVRALIDVRVGLPLVLAVVIVAGALALARTGAALPVGAGLTQLWVVPAQSGSIQAVRLGVTSTEPGGMTYRLEVRAGGQPIGNWPSIALDSAGTWQTTVTLPVRPDEGPDAAAAMADAVEAVLYRADAPDVPYRHVSVWRSQSGQGGVRRP
jgi:uncharacterized membrane protein